MDLDRSLEDVRKGLDRKWRNHLNSAEKNNLEIRSGHGDELFELFLPVYREMLSRKRLAESSDIRAFRAMQSSLPDHFKMRVIVALEDGSPCAGALCSAIGKQGIYHFGATAESGMKNKASYLVQWTAIQWLKQVGCTEYDLHGSNAEANPGVYSFKMGLCGKNGREIESLGQFEAHGSKGSEFLLRVADHANRGVKKIKGVRGRFFGAGA
jgi:lipid II:glycine glycyltransferase (peptidoglycan interpeptide bridge formation enzyme)